MGEESKSSATKASAGRSATKSKVEQTRAPKVQHTDAVRSRPDRDSTPQKTCFVISPIGEPDSDTRKRADQILRHVIKPTVDPLGYTALRADQIDKPGLITSQVIQHVVASPLVIADLTGRNPNVFYELAIRHAIRKPLVQLMKKGEPIPFDVAGTRTIFVDDRDLDSVAEAREEIGRQIASLEHNPDELETPISLSLELQSLRESGNPEERTLGEMIELLSDLRSGLNRVEGRLAEHSPESIFDKISAVHLDLQKLSSRAPLYRTPSDPRKTMDLEVLEPVVARRSGLRESRATTVLVVASLFKDAAPWIHDYGRIVAEALVQGRKNADNLVSDFRGVVQRFVDMSSFFERYGKKSGEIHRIIVVMLSAL